jgi:hypothetical protein
MSRLTLGLILGLLAMTFGPSAAEADCTPAGWVLAGPSGSYNHIANGWPEVDDCWNANSARTGFVSDNSCGYASNAYIFGYGGSLSQIVTVPAGMTQAQWEFVYRLDFDDPNNSPYWNRISVTLTDLTTNMVLVSDNYSSGPPVTCSERRLPFTGNFAGRQILVSINGTTAYPNSIIKVRRMALWQWE